MTVNRTPRVLFFHGHGYLVGYPGAGYDVFWMLVPGLDTVEENWMPVPGLDTGTTYISTVDWSRSRG